MKMYVDYLRVRLGVPDERGASGVEYGLLVALIAAVIIVAVTSVGTKTNAGFTALDSGW